MKLNLRKPLIFFDLETTGLNIMTDRIVEIAYLKIYPNGNEESKKMRINPEISILSLSAEDVITTSEISVGDVGGISVRKSWSDLDDEA
jgi:DNA polymerase III epsilon subunit-like protein